MQDEFLRALYQEHQKAPFLPATDHVCQLFHRHLEMLFPEFTLDKFHSLQGFKIQWNKLKQDYIDLFQKLDLKNKPVHVVNQFFDQIPEVKRKLELDAQAIYSGDPAAVNIYEVKRSYPGFLAIAYYRFAHLMHHLGVPYCPRILTEEAHSRTGIDIHPNAKIGLHFCIDHGTGVVIGETTQIGDHVKIYQGVTLGALSVDKEMASIKRHPTIEDHVVIYSGATILGGGTIIGQSSVIGGNVWLTKSVPSNSKIYYQPSISELKEI
ncbi:serine O-acetyltransferase [Membranicola marinus]|uniref:Serine O-acetyltransferase n=1 Tax=Membranihabitans marinus TaxID=1227546 RepID=A0A953LAP5_9BACT|nr:serine O-acetyltransferase [Membranihabitans marinus]MBY5960180.1 serine O-acetyltransferase [Membranihabitans marinus]